MSQITYILGAGASCGLRLKEKTINKDSPRGCYLHVHNEVLPLINEIPKRIEEVIDFINSFTTNKKASLNINHQDDTPDFEAIKAKLVKDFIELKKEVMVHASIDTLAKKLFISEPLENDSRQVKYDKLKCLIDLFFISEQYIRGLDLRYDLFFATILNCHKGKQILMPSSLNIITWNYDFQIDLSLKNYFTETKLNSLKEYYSSNLKPNPEYDINSNQFSVMYLNGQAGATFKENEFQCDELPLNDFTNKEDFSKKQSEFVRSLLMKYHHYNNRKIEPAIKYAWELIKDLNAGQKGMFESISHIIDSTDILVVIGYSFPTFNREVDKIILRNLKERSRIYIQVPDKDYLTIVYKLKALTKNKDYQYFQVNGLNEFYIPYEFDY